MEEQANAFRKAPFAKGWIFGRQHPRLARTAGTGKEGAGARKDSLQRNFAGTAAASSHFSTCRGLVADVSEKTSGSAGGSAVVRGWVDDPPETALVWRTYLPVRKGGTAPRQAEIEAFFEAAPPHTSELLEAETFRVADWVFTRVKKTGKEHADQNSSELEVRLCDEDVVAFVLDPDGTLRKRFTLGALKSPPDKDKFKSEFKDTLTGAALIVDARLGGLKDGLLDDEADDPPPTADGSEWLGDGAVGFRIRIETSEAAPRDPNWRERFRFACEVSEEGQPRRWLAVEKWRNDAATEDD